MSVISLSTKGGHPKVNECRKSKLKFLVFWTKISCQNCNIKYVYNSKYLSECYFYCICTGCSGMDFHNLWLINSSQRSFRKVKGYENPCMINWLYRLLNDIVLQSVNLTLSSTAYKNSLNKCLTPMHLYPPWNFKASYVSSM